MVGDGYGGEVARVRLLTDIQDMSPREQIHHLEHLAEQMFCGECEDHVERGFFDECEDLMWQSSFEAVRHGAKLLRDQYLCEEMGISPDCRRSREQIGGIADLVSLKYDDASIGPGGRLAKLDADNNPIPEDS